LGTKNKFLKRGITNLAEGFEVDDNNEALPENRPALFAPPIKVSADGLSEGNRGAGTASTKEQTRGGMKNHLSRTDGRPLARRRTLTSSYVSSHLYGSRMLSCQRCRMRWREKMRIR
jgi:hypothetical protein